MVRSVLAGLFVLLGLALAGPHAWADQKSDDIKALLDLTNQNSGAIEKSANERVRAIIQNFIDAHPDLTGQDVVAIETQIAAVQKDYVDSLRADTASYFYDHLSDEQIRAVIAFYRTPEGVAYLAATGDLSRSILIAAQQRLPALIASIRDILLTALKGHNLLPQSANPKAG